MRAKYFKHLICISGGKFEFAFGINFFGTIHFFSSILEGIALSFLQMVLFQFAVSQKTILIKDHKNTWPIQKKLYRWAQPKTVCRSSLFDYLMLDSIVF
jgi:hypothetical protein